jgi:lipopolysaccharide transport system ATP-binding protein
MAVPAERDPHGVTADLDEEVGISVEDLGTRPSALHAARYTPTMSLFTRFTDRRSGIWGSITAEADEGDPDEDDDADDDDRDGHEEFDDTPGLTLRGVAFTVRRGQALGVVGDADSGARALARVLCGMIMPVRGRVRVRGRVALSVELALLLARRETHPRRAARTLAMVAGVSWRDRRAFVRGALDAASAGVSTPRGADGYRSFVARVAQAAAIDPTADVLVVDRLPARADHAFRERCIERVSRALEHGAAVLVTALDLDAVSELCSEAVWLDDGIVVAAGTTDEVLARYRRAMSPVAPTPVTPPKPKGLPSFTDTAAVHDVVARRADGSAAHDFGLDEPMQIDIALELARGGMTFGIRLRAFGAVTQEFAKAWPDLLDAGRYVLSVRFAPGRLEPGEYDIEVDTIFKRSGDRTAVGRRCVDLFSIAGDPGDELIAAQVGPELVDAGDGGADVDWIVVRPDD